MDEVRVLIFKDSHGSFRALPPEHWIRANNYIREICEISMQYHYESPWKAVYGLWMACQVHMEEKGYSGVIPGLIGERKYKYGRYNEKISVSPRCSSCLKNDTNVVCIIDREASRKEASGWCSIQRQDWRQRAEAGLRESICTIGMAPVAIWFFFQNSNLQILV